MIKIDYLTDVDTIDKQDCSSLIFVGFFYTNVDSVGQHLLIDEMFDEMQP